VTEHSGINVLCCREKSAQPTTVIVDRREPGWPSAAQSEDGDIRYQNSVLGQGVGEKLQPVVVTAKAVNEHKRFRALG
jgi:hypothetical protein